jgi:hypothetical protein
MSLRRNRNTEAKEVEKLREELDELKRSSRAADASDIGTPVAASDAMDKLSAVEQSAAHLGVNPDAWKPISFLNQAHYEQLIAANMLDDDLARRIEASARRPTHVLHLTLTRRHPCPCAGLPQRVQGVGLVLGLGCWLIMTAINSIFSTEARSGPHVGARP